MCFSCEGRAVARGFRVLRAQIAVGPVEPDLSGLAGAL